jgi:NitT/TauT family transport system substrate-binding protein
MLLLTAACGGSQPSAGGSAAQAPTPTTDTTPATVRVGHVASTAYAPLYVALDRGYFDRLHLKVDLVPIRAGQNAVDLVSRGVLDAVMADMSAGMFNALAAGRRFKVVGSLAVLPADGSAPLALEVARPLFDSGQVKTLADLKGRRIAIEGGAENGGGYLADLALQRAGVGLESMKVVDIGAGSMEPAIASGGIDVALVPAPYTRQMEQHGVAMPLATPPAGSTWNGVLFGAGLHTSAAQRFFEALVRAARDLEGPARSSDGTVTTLARYTGVTADVLRTVPPYDWERNLMPDPTELGAMQAAYRRFGLLQYPRDVPAVRYVDASYAKRAATVVP